MLNKPPLCDLMEHVDSKYGLVIMVAKRARGVVDRNPDVVSTGRFNAVSMAMREVADGKLHWKTAEADEPAPAAEPAPEEEADVTAELGDVDDLPDAPVAAEADPE